MDTKFSVALHILSMISESKETLNSQLLAESVGTNASYIRKILALLKNAGLIRSQQGKVGIQLNKKPDEISLLEIYYATQEVSRIKLFQAHQNPNPACPVGQHIDAAISPIFEGLEQQLEEQLANQTLDVVMKNLYASASRTRQD